MLAEFVSKIATLAQSAKAVEIAKDPQFPDEVLVRSGDAFEWKKAPAPKRAHHIHSLADFMAAARDKVIAPTPEVYHDHKSIVLVLDRAGRREIVQLALLETDRFKTLRGLQAAEKTLSVRDAVRLIRFELHGVGADVLVAALGRLDFNRTGIEVAGAKHGRETLGRSVESAVQQADQVPETFVARLPVYSNPGLRTVVADVRCGIYLDMQNPGVVIRPLADEIENATDFAQGELHGLLEAGLPDVPIFNGKFA